MAKKRKKGVYLAGRTMIMLAAFSAAFLLLIGRTAWLQIVQGEKLSRDALQQQTSDNTVSAKRGKIYDRNLKVLASNVSVETISIAPAELRSSIKKRLLIDAPR